MYSIFCIHKYVCTYSRHQRVGFWAQPRPQRSTGSMAFPVPARQMEAERVDIDQERKRERERERERTRKSRAHPAPALQYFAQEPRIVCCILLNPASQLRCFASNPAFLRYCPQQAYVLCWLCHDPATILLLIPTRRSILGYPIQSLRLN